MGHVLGATTAAAMLALALPAGISLLSDSTSQGFYVQGFQLSSLMVVFVLCFGAMLAFFHRAPALSDPPPRPAPEQTASTAAD